MALFGFIGWRANRLKKAKNRRVMARSGFTPVVTMLGPKPAKSGHKEEDRLIPNRLSARLLA
jgi:hypothetical protein